MPGQTQDFALVRPARPRESPLALAVRRLLRGRSSRIALVVLGIIVLVGLLAPFIAPYNPSAQPDIVGLKDLPPSLAHPFGTDPYSRDVLSRVIYGARLSLLIGVLATIVSLTLGVAYGAIAGYAGGFIDAVMMRLLDALLSIPRLLLLLGVLVAWPRLSIGALVLFLGFTGWFGLSRIVRGQVLALKHAEFVMAARALGASRRRILLRHLLPNLVSPIVVAATLGVAHVIVLEAGLSYLGIGVPQPQASWGNIIQDGADQVSTLWWMSLFPGLFMVFTVMTLNILGEALRDAYERRS
ncbi:MAG TPA: ABC transporter permease [Gemmatimonadaceae bacterium]|jgi:peptide/nickel transport system permease protein|nr:ABC transporter permease [Gemmatimonadaceae bacterium]